MNSIYQTLKQLGLSSDRTKTLFNKKTRDVNELNVWRDSKSGVIFIDDYYTGDQTYIDGVYRSNELKFLEEYKKFVHEFYNDAK